ncbi:capsid cement protein [Caulobacter sp. BP25]|uniref:capsid cement protein n=1 Tax=Caulobacter sp. BP25 TaxID=2048900 RepID=UPI000C12C34B|nr:capsid cement protein [Caulobacter sp. BP25]PHY20809.1 DUF2190 domain-containing protein [Caulobacter sp. BP25]
MHPGLTKNYTAGAAVARRRIVKFDAVDGQVLQGAAATDAIFGVSDMSADCVAGDRVDVRLTGVAEIDVGGAITRGAPVTSDANGKAVAAAPAAGSNVRIIGFANATYANGDIGDFLLSQGLMQG